MSWHPASPARASGLSSPRTALGQIYLLCYLFCHFAMISTFLLLCLTGFETFGWELWTLIGPGNIKVFSGEIKCENKRFLLKTSSSN